MAGVIGIQPHFSVIHRSVDLSKRALFVISTPYNHTYFFFKKMDREKQRITNFLAHLCRRLKGELIVYQSSCRLCVCVCLSVCKHFQT